ncbi:m-AAA protease-interacting protein 1, mitochondrial isoform X2 [Heterocephalus glaber]|uniref:M-AAA protease-interacting protein 1, mitochondrial isoform X2 n=1 Tax=Heterocephalus glaber TaxID=10181 RepID=A0AAX6SAD3_HETGA|nr:m-AAA protease-interacting protein 1, mitochondrial isoform X2 [Heterocephalus glaber]
MALAARLFPRSLLAWSLPGGAARLRTPRGAAARPQWAGLCCSCRRRLGSGAALCPRRPGPWLAPGVPAALAACPSGPRRGYSTEGQRPGTRMIVLGFSNPVTWVRTRVLAFLVWAYFDREFSITEFSEAAKQAFSHVSRLLSQCKFDLLEELVSKEVLPVLKRKVTSLPDNHRNALAADIGDIVYTSTGDISIYYDEKVPASPARLCVEPVCSRLSWGIRMWKLSSFLVQVMNFRENLHKE